MMDKYRYKILHEIGKGSFGTVYKARKVRSDYAIKKVRCDAPENVELALQEFWTLSSLRAHNNIIRYEECYLQHGKEIRPMQHGDTSSSAYMYLVEMALKGKRGWDQAQYYLWFVMEYCNCGDMNDFILDRDPIAYLNTIFMIQLADGIAFLHKSNVVHRDLKPENVLVCFLKGRDPVLKIADFGLSKVCNRPVKDTEEGQGDDECDINVDTCWLSSACGSDFFMAPEVFEGRYTAKADVFALGIMFWAIMDRITFIDASTKKVLLGTYVRRDKEVLPVGEALLDDPNLDMTQLLVDTGQGPGPGQRSKRSQSRSCVAGSKKKLRDLIVQMVHPNPEFRPSSQELQGRLSSILQPNDRPKNMDLTTKKPETTKSNLVQSKAVQRNSSASEKVHLSQKAKTKLKQVDPCSRKANSKPSEMSEKKLVDEITRQASGKESFKTKTGKLSSRKVKSKNAAVESNAEAQRQHGESEPKSENTIVRVKNARRKKALSAVKKSKKTIKPVTRNLRSRVRKLEVRKGKEISEDESEAVDSHDTNTGPNSSVDTPPPEVKNDPMKSHLPVRSLDPETTRKSLQITAEEDVSSDRNTSKQKLKLRNFVCPAKIQQQESDEGADFLMETDGESRDSSIASEIPEFDSGYKSKKSRRISHISDINEELPSETRDNVETCGDETTNNDNKPLGGNGLAALNITQDVKKNISCPISSCSADTRPMMGENQSPMLYHRRHTGLKEQIRACKPRADVEARRPSDESKYSYDLSMPQSIEESKKKIPEMPQKSKLEVPRTPCVVMQSKVKMRHNPFHTAVKKRWKYVVLDDLPPPAPREASTSYPKNLPMIPQPWSIAGRSIADDDIRESNMNFHRATTSTDLAKKDAEKKTSAKYASCRQETEKRRLSRYKGHDSHASSSTFNGETMVKQTEHPSGFSSNATHGFLQNGVTKTEKYMRDNSVKKEPDRFPPYGQNQAMPVQREQLACKKESVVRDTQYAKVLHENAEDKCQLDCCRRNPNQTQHPLLQQLTNYWCQSSKTHPNPHKVVEISEAHGQHQLYQGTNLSVDKQYQNLPEFLISCRDTLSPARRRTTVASNQLTSSSENISIPTIDLTLDEYDDYHYQPSNKRRRYEDPGKKARNPVHDPKLRRYEGAVSNSIRKARKPPRDQKPSSLIAEGTSGASILPCTCQSCNAYSSTLRTQSCQPVPQALHLGNSTSTNNISFQLHNMSSNRLETSQTVFQRPLGMPDLSQYYNDSFSSQNNPWQDLYPCLQVNSQTSMPPTLMFPPALQPTTSNFFPYGLVHEEHDSLSSGSYLRGHHMQGLPLPLPYASNSHMLDRPQQLELPAMPSLLYCGSPAIGTDSQSLMHRNPPNLLKIDELRRVSQQMQQRSPYLSPPKLQRAITVPNMMPQYQGNHMMTSANSNNFSCPESNVHTFPTYPYQLRHPKPILNK